MSKEESGQIKNARDYINKQRQENGLTPSTIELVYKFGLHKEEAEKLLAE